MGLLDELHWQPAWMRDANCRNREGINWFPERGSRPAALADLREICDGCLVTDECLAYALEHRFQSGVFAGTTPRERRRMQRGRDGYGASSNAAAPFDISP